ncbi:MAG: glycosyltransferase family 4 protein, partial [Planctomycetota bacterium]
MSDRFPIAYVAGQFPLRSETFVWREVRELRQRGWTVHTFGLRRPTDVPESLRDLLHTTELVYERLPARTTAGQEVVVRPRLTSWPSRAMADMIFPRESTSLRNRLTLHFQAEAGNRLAARLHDLGIRHVHAHFAHAPTSVAMYAADAAGVPFSFTGHANDLFQRRQLLRRKLERAAFVGCISEWHRDLYRSIHPDGRYDVVRCGVPIGDYGPPPERVPDRLRVLTVCRLVEKKGVDTLVQATANLPGVSVTVAGDGPMRKSLEAAAGANATFLGPVDAERVPELLREHDAFALPCRPVGSGDRDGIPVVLMEAMAAGLPVVAGDLPAIRELVEDGVTGRLLTVEDRPIERQAEALRTLLDRWRMTPEATTTMAQAG